MTTQLPLPFDPRPSLRGEDFLVASCNRDAIAWIDRWPDWPGPALAVAGAAGCGKSHLASVWAAASGARYVDRKMLSAGITAIDGDGPFVIDDADRLMGIENCERSLFHLLNRLMTLRGRLLLTGCRPPARWGTGLPDLASRLGTVPVATIGSPDDDLMQALLVKLFADRQVDVDPAVIHFMAARMERSFDTARRLVRLIDQQALAQRRSVTIPLVRAAIDAQP